LASPSPGGHTRKRFALKGRSIAVDPRIHAVRRDLADVRLADRVFAPHYVAPLPRKLISHADLRAAASSEAEVLTHLPAEASFEVLEYAGAHAWGIAPDAALVGYIPIEALGGEE
jgi:hypothetical protein